MGKVILNPERLSFENWADYLQALQDNELEKGFTIIRPAIVDWDLSVPLEGDRPDLGLSFGELPDILYSIRDTIEKFQDGLDVEDCDTDLNKATMKDYYAYTDALKSGDVAEIERYFKLVAKPKRKDYDPKARLSLHDGLLIRKAVEKQTAHLFRKR